MYFDHSSLIIAIGISSVAIFLTLTASWLQARQDAFLFRQSVGAILIAAAATVYGGFEWESAGAVGAAFFPVLLSAFAFLYGGASVFRTPEHPASRIGVAAAIAIAPVSAAFLAGFDGTAFALGNYAAAALLFASGLQYMRRIGEARRPMSILVFLYLATSVSFVLCGTAILIETPLHLDGIPSNWTEDLNVVMSVLGIAGAGAITLSLNQARAAAAHRKDAMTDQMTGLLNRRALFDAAGGRKLREGNAVVLIDLDSFKAINDSYGHAVGDDVISRLGLRISEAVGGKHLGARLGGEEFAVLLRNVDGSRASAFAERLREEFALEAFATPGGMISCTLSAGVACAGPGGTDFERLLREADEALYCAKRAGRNRVSSTARAIAIRTGLAA